MGISKQFSFEMVFLLLASSFCLNAQTIKLLPPTGPVYQGVSLALKAEVAFDELNIDTTAIQVLYGEGSVNTRTVTVNIVPREVGKFIVGPFIFNGTTSNALELTVTERPQPGKLQLTVPDTIYVDEDVEIEISAIALGERPDMPDFKLQRSDSKYSCNPSNSSISSSMKMTNGVFEYQTAYAVKIRPLKKGKLKITP